MKLVLFQPEIAANVGACIRNCVCFGAELHIIEPCGFPLKQKDIRRVGMDYGALTEPHYHASWPRFVESPARSSGRLVLMTTKASQSLNDFAFTADDLLLIGQESAGVPPYVVEEAEAAVRIPLAPEARSLNMAVAGAVSLFEAQRQLQLLD
jgi:tRNA (cytidine/uridine-2'-O-)-methyltransferase